MDRGKMEGDPAGFGVGEIKQLAGDVGLVKIRPLAGVGRPIPANAGRLAQVIKMAKELIPA